ncbi:deoxycytidyl transferase [Kickxella alabastrina]|uniref:Deoxycytidyl transferase n=1 Tax=Kickxella alabastrina TaxID=61397 RepID=A0ACC1IUI0_9FUNG|nr:deoxycytidyl transferase [Kickxella alabastrina]
MEPSTIAPAFGDFNAYYGQRKRKLAEQAKQRAVNAPKYDHIFDGVVFHINGYTQPSHYELKLILIERGGQFLHYLSKTQVTHIIASGLAMSKEKEFRNYKVVRPEWVVDSVKAGKQLAWHKYALIGQGNTGLPAVKSSYDDNMSSLADTDCSRDVLGRPPVHLGISANDSAINRAMVMWPEYIPVIDRFEEGLNREWVRKNLATEKDFIQRYYASSRLHHLSTWKVELKDYVAQLRRKQGRPSTLNQCGGSAIPRDRIIMHVDFDCFFVSASLLSHPYLRDKPVAVCHSQQHHSMDTEDSDGLLAVSTFGQSSSTSQIASCNYIARSFGVKNGMVMNQARQLCPALMAIPYQFDVYKRISRTFYDIVTAIADETQAVSVDEALLDVTERLWQDFDGNSELLAQNIRQRVYKATGCAVSVGIGPSILLARVATTRAKPDGVHSLNTQSFCNLNISVCDLPGIGNMVEGSLASNGISSVAEVRATGLQRLQDICGEKMAVTLFNFSRGVDEGTLESDKPRQVFGADIGWGVRFSNQADADNFIVRLASEVCRTMSAAERTGSSVTLKIKKRREGEGKPAKFLGHGICDSLSKSAVLSRMTNEPGKVASACIKLLHQMSIDPLDIRSVGIQVYKLNSFDASGEGGIGSMLAKSKAKFSEGPNSGQHAFHDLPTASQLDTSVLSELPDSIRQELESYYRQTSPGASMTTTAGSRSAMGVSPRESPHTGSAGLKTPRSGIGSGRRGRPRKLAFQPTSSGSKGKQANVNLLQAFKRLETLDFIMPSQMDTDVWGNLPMSIRRELAREYIKTKPTVSEKITPLTNHNLAAADAKAMVATGPSIGAALMPMLYGASDVNDVHRIVGAWVDSSSAGPLEEDIDEVGDYIEELVQHHDLMKATNVLKYFKFRCMQQSDSQLWQIALKIVLGRANKMCAGIYGAYLDI